MSNIIISFCIPTYNRANLLNDTLFSIFSQSSNIFLPYIEIIVSDNNSTDNTYDIVARYIKTFPGIIKYHKNNANIWSKKNVIKVTTYAEWKYLWLLSDDDCITNFSLEYLLEIIHKTDFDILFNRTKSTENISINIQKKDNSFSLYNWIEEYLDYLLHNFHWYKNLISFFSFYSSIIVKRSYFYEWLKSITEETIYSVDFPHEVIIYNNLIYKKILIPDNIFVLARILNESYGGSIQLVSDFKKLMNYIEKKNHLKWYLVWKKIKNICIKWWTKTMFLWILLKRLNLNYKTSPFLKKVYYLYKRYLQ